MVLSNVSPHHEHGSSLVFSPLLSQFVTPCGNPDKDGLVTAALLTLSGAQPLLVASIYAPAGRTWRHEVETAIRPLLQKYPNFLLGGDFNRLVNPALDGRGLQNDNHWPWIRHSATATPPLLGDTFRLANPTAQEYTRYPFGLRTSSSRIDYIFMSPESLAKFPLLNATIHTNDRATDHHPTPCTLSVPPTPFHPSTVTKRVFRKLEAVAAGSPYRYPLWLARALNSAIYDVKWDYEIDRAIARIADFYVKIAVFYKKFMLLCTIL